MDKRVKDQLELTLKRNIEKIVSSNYKIEEHKRRIQVLSIINQGIEKQLEKEHGDKNSKRGNT